MTGPSAILVGVLDSGIGGAPQDGVIAASSFTLSAEAAVVQGPSGDDQVGHGTVLAGHILAAAPGCRLLDAQVFSVGMASTPLTIAVGLDWLVGEGAHIVNMSFGLREDRPVLRESCRAAAAAGVVLIAAAPARGPMPYPAAYGEVISVQGDARCALGEVSRLGGPQADFGTYPRSLGPLPEGVMVGGASWAASHFSGLAAAYLAEDPETDPGKLRHHFAHRAAYLGPERRSGPATTDDEA